jgi:hypothetical protein
MIGAGSVPAQLQQRASKWALEQIRHISFIIAAVWEFHNFVEARRGRLPNPLSFCIDPPLWGHVAEWLRSGLQNRLHQFNSGRGLQ